MKADSLKIYLFIMFAVIPQLIFANTAKTRIDSINSLPHEMIVKDLSQSIKLFKENALNASTIKYDYGEALAYQLLAKVYYLNGKYIESTETFLKAIKIMEQHNDPSSLASAYGEFGYQLKRNDLEKANQYMRKALLIAEENILDSVLCSIYNNYGVLKEMENNLDSASIYYNKSLVYNYKLKSLIGVPYSLNKIAGVEAMKGNFKKALSILKESDSFRAKEEGNYGRTENLALYGDVYSLMGEVDSAILYYNLCKDLAIQSGINYPIRYCYENLTKLYKKMGNYEKAYESLESFTNYKDSVLNEDIRLKVKQLEIDYETEKKDKEIAENKLMISEKNLQLYLSFGLILILGVIFSTIYIVQKKKREQEKNELALKNEIEKATLENKISDEKLRISRELHDNIGSQLTFMVSSIDNLTYHEKEDEKNTKLNTISNFGRETLNDLRNTIWALKNEESDLNELILRVNELIRSLKSGLGYINIELSCKADKSIKLSATQLLNMYRIIQESIQNCIKYAKPTQINIYFIDEKGKLELKICDNGSGFNIENVKNKSGLNNMKFRCEESGGQFSITSGENGTSISCLIN